MKGLLTMTWDFVLSVAGWIFAGLVVLSTLWAGFVLYRRSVKSWFFCSLSWTLSSQNCSEKRKRKKGSLRAGRAGHRHFVQVNVWTRCLVDLSFPSISSCRQHQMVGREGKGGHSFLAIDHIRDQLIPPQVFFYPTTWSSFKVHFIFRREAIKLRSGTKQLLTSELTRAGCEEFG